MRGLAGDLILVTSYLPESGESERPVGGSASIEEGVLLPRKAPQRTKKPERVQVLSWEAGIL